MPDELTGTVAGVAQNVRWESQGNSKVLRFRFDCGDGLLIPVELHGDDIEGDLASGERVEITIAGKDAGATAIRLQSLRNLSTGFSVQATGKSRADRVGDFVSANAATAAITTVVSGGVSLLLAKASTVTSGVKATPSASSSATAAGTPFPSPSPTSGSVTGPAAHAVVTQAWSIYLLLAVLLDAVACLALYWRLRRGNRKGGVRHRPSVYLRSGRVPVILAGLLAGEFLTALILWLTHTTFSLCRNRDGRPARDRARAVHSSAVSTRRGGCTWMKYSLPNSSLSRKSGNMPGSMGNWLR